MTTLLDTPVDRTAGHPGARAQRRPQALRCRHRSRRHLARRPPRRGARASRRQRRRQATLIKCLSGVHRLDSGSIEMDGVPVTIHAVRCALGVETVYQDLALFDNLRPTDNFYAGRELAGPTWLPRAPVPQAQADDGVDARGARAAPGVASGLPYHRRADVRRTAAGGGREQGRRVRFEGRDPRRAHGRARRARVAPGARPDPPAGARTGP